eukprot:1161664-Pelagomonas_calceolata.AAC.14
MPCGASATSAAPHPSLPGQPCSVPVHPSHPPGRCVHAVAVSGSWGARDEEITRVASLLPVLSVPGFRTQVMQVAQVGAPGGPLYAHSRRFIRQRLQDRP